MAAPASCRICCGSLEAAGVRDIVFDVDFSTPSDPASDQAFVEALGAPADRWCCRRSSSRRRRRHAPTSIVRSKQFRDNAWSAVVNVDIEPDGLVRRYPFGEKLDGEFLPSMGAVLAGQYRQKRPPFLIDFGIRARSIPQVSYVDVLRGDPATLDR